MKTYFIQPFSFNLEFQFSSLLFRMKSDVKYNKTVFKFMPEKIKKITKPQFMKNKSSVFYTQIQTQNNFFNVFLYPSPLHLSNSLKNV
jgi:hypothetical protein